MIGQYKCQIPNFVNLGQLSAIRTICLEHRLSYPCSHACSRIFWY